MANTNDLRGLTPARSAVTFFVDSEAAPLAIGKDIRGGFAAFTTTERDAIDRRKLENGQIIFNITLNRYEKFTQSSNRDANGNLAGTWSEFVLTSTFDDSDIRRDIQNLIDSDSEIRQSILDVIAHILDSDSDTTLRLNQEILDRIAGDNRLDLRIDSEVLARMQADSEFSISISKSATGNSLVTRLIHPNGRVDSDSIIIGFNGVPISETTSIFTNSLVPGRIDIDSTISQQQQLIRFSTAGDTVPAAVTEGTDTRLQLNIRRSSRVDTRIDSERVVRSSADDELDARIDSEKAVRAQLEHIYNGTGPGLVPLVDTDGPLRNNRYMDGNGVWRDRGDILDQLRLSRNDSDLRVTRTSVEGVQQRQRIRFQVDSSVRTILSGVDTETVLAPPTLANLGASNSSSPNARPSTYVQFFTNGVGINKPAGNRFDNTIGVGSRLWLGAGTPTNQGIDNIFTGLRDALIADGDAINVVLDMSDTRNITLEWTWNYFAQQDSDAILTRTDWILPNVRYRRAIDNGTVTLNFAPLYSVTTDIITQGSTEVSTLFDTVSFQSFQDETFHGNGLVDRPAIGETGTDYFLTGSGSWRRLSIAASDSDLSLFGVNTIGLVPALTGQQANKNYIISGDADAPWIDGGTILDRLELTHNRDSIGLARYELATRPKQQLDLNPTPGHSGLGGHTITINIPRYNSATDFDSDLTFSFAASVTASGELATFQTQIRNTIVAALQAEPQWFVNVNEPTNNVITWEHVMVDLRNDGNFGGAIPASVRMTFSDTINVNPAPAGDAGKIPNHSAIIGNQSGSGLVFNGMPDSDVSIDLDFIHVFDSDNAGIVPSPVSLTGDLSRYTLKADGTWSNFTLQRTLNNETIDLQIGTDTDSLVVLPKVSNSSAGLVEKYQTATLRLPFPGDVITATSFTDVGHGPWDTNTFIIGSTITFASEADAITVQNAGSIGVFIVADANNYGYFLTAGLATNFTRSGSTLTVASNSALIYQAAQSQGQNNRDNANDVTGYFGVARNGNVVDIIQKATEVSQIYSTAGWTDIGHITEHVFPGFAEFNMGLTFDSELRDSSNNVVIRKVNYNNEAFYLATLPTEQQLRLSLNDPNPYLRRRF